MTILETPRGYELKIDRRPSIVAEVKAIAGVRYFGKDRGWFIPIQQRNEVEKLKAKYVRITEGSNSPEQVFKIDDLPELTIDLPLKLEPYAYQKKGIARGIQLKRFINGDQPGLGKTLQAIGTILGLDQTGTPSFPCLVICPTTLKENWRREWEDKFSHKRALVLSDKNKHTWHSYWRMGMADVFIVNYESLSKYFVHKIDIPKGKKKMQLKDVQFFETITLFKSVILDEIHRLKDPTTRVAKLSRGITLGKKIIIGLTGTPVVNKPIDLVSQLAIVNRIKEFGGYSYFKYRYCKGGTGAAYLNELNSKLNSTCFFRREKKEVLKELPDKMREVLLCDISTRLEYNKARNEFVNYLHEKGFSQIQIDKKLQGEIMVKFMMLKHISARGKMAEVVEHVQAVVDAGEKIVIFCHLKEIALELMKHFPDAVTVRGDDSMDARQHAVDKFQTDPEQLVIICSIKAAGVGLTLTAASRVVFVEQPWHPADSDQCEDRCHRIGQKDSVQITNFLGKDTIDEDIYKLIDDKRSISNTITGSTEQISTLITDLTKNLFNQR